MVNKTYLLGKDDVSPSGGEDWSISCLNFPFLHADIFNNILIWKNSRLTKPDKIPIKGADRGSVTLKDITEYLAEQGYDKKMGARPLGRKIDTLLRVPLSKKILFEGVQSGSTVAVDFVNDKFEFTATTTPQPHVDENGFISLA